MIGTDLMIKFILIIKNLKIDFFTKKKMSPIELPPKCEAIIFHNSAKSVVHFFCSFCEFSSINWNADRWAKLNRTVILFFLKQPFYIAIIMIVHCFYRFLYTFIHFLCLLKATNFFVYTPVTMFGFSQGFKFGPVYSWLVNYKS